jgi:outer membrane biosynthesis protein TonB
LDRGASLCLKDADLTLAGEFFRDPGCVFLMIQPRKGEPANAGFFFWDGAQLNGDFCFMEFPFDARLLAGERQPSPPRGLAEPPTVRAMAPEVGRARAFFRQTPRTVLAASLVAIAILSIGVLLMLRSPAKGIPGMRVERQGQSLTLTWDRKSRPVTNAKAALLSIKDGVLTRKVSLDAMHLRSGSVSYSPVDSQVEFEMTLIAHNGSVSRDETLAAPPPVPAVAPVIAPPPAPEAPKLEARNTAAASKPRWVRGADVPAPAAASKPRWVPGADVSAPAAARVPVKAQAEKPGGSPPLREARLASVQQAAVPKMAPMVNRPVYMPPQPLSQVAPVVPSNLVRLIRRETVVVVRVSIDAAGNVIQARPVADSLSAFLIPVAVTAARQWTFRPAWEGNQKLPSETVLRFRFVPYALSKTIAPG